jgi:CRISPR-associated endonuclease/helicase Cas3
MEFPEIWAKSPEEPGGVGQSLVTHTRAVLARLASLRERQPMLPDLCGQPRLWRWAALACALHDLGKCAPGFQAMVHGGGSRFPHRHEVISLSVLPILLDGAAKTDLRWVAAGIVSHHWELAKLREAYPRADPTMDIPDGCAALVRALDQHTVERMWAVATEALLPAAAALGFVDRGSVSGAAPRFVEWATWVPGNVRRCLDAVEGLAGKAVGVDQTALACRFLRGLVLLSDHAGSAGEAFTDVPAFADPASMRCALARITDASEPYDHQRAAMETGTPAVLVAPTGSGKTEASLLWAAAQRREGRGAPPIFYVLPYQASLNAMRARLGDLFGDPAVVLQHSRAVEALYRQLLDRGYSPADAARTAVHEKNLGRLHVSPVRVTTPYQLLRGAYQLRGHPALWADAAGGIFILDEVHAYETTRLGMILELLSHLTQDLGARVLVLSATFPGVLREALAAAVGRASEIVASGETHERFRRHRLLLAEGELVDPETVARIAGSARRGMAVLVVATTVARAQAIWSELRRPEHLGSAAKGVRLLHSRFCARDRFLKELEVRASLATDGQRLPGEPTVLVATQVVEVSLDIDFDVLFSDPAPLEALVQRFGRVNRRRRLPTADVVVMTRVPEDSPVYPAELVHAALARLRTSAGETIDEAGIQTWLDEIYRGEIAAEWHRGVVEARSAFRRDVLDSLTVFDSSPELTQRFDDLFDGSEILPRGLEAEYRERRRREPLAASELMVPITSRQASWLARQGRLRRDVDGLRIADVHYDAELGLDLARQAPDGI